MTKREKSSLIEYRYNKLCRLECNLTDSYNFMIHNIDNYHALSYHLYDVIYVECFKSVMRDVFELLKLKDVR